MLLVVEGRSEGVKVRSAHFEMGRARVVLYLFLTFFWEALWGGVIISD